jgi:hypothetical protein
MIDKIKNNWKPIAFAVFCLAIIKLSSCAAMVNNKVIEAFYQSAQDSHRTELARRQASIVMLKKAERNTAATYQSRIDKMAAATDARIAAPKWRSNAELRESKAAAGEILAEKSKAETALAEMTLNRDGLLALAGNREKEIVAERLRLQGETDSALKTAVDQLALCDRARQSALAACGRKTWVSIGPGISVFFSGGEIRYAYSLSIQIPIIQIKSPFKRF